MASQDEESRASSLPQQMQEQQSRASSLPQGATTVSCGSELARDASCRELSRGVLMVAFHFPPQKGSSGLQRTLRFVQHLRGLGWAPTVLTAHERAYGECADDQLAEIPADVPVLRAFALDTARHLAIRGKYLGAMALPDRWWTWVVPAFFTGLRAIRRSRPAVLYSTSPIPSAQLVGWALHRATGLPWVADLRDPLTGRASAATRGLRHRAQAFVERCVARRAAHIVFTTSAARADFHGRYPALPLARLHVVENGYDECDFLAAEALAAALLAHAPAAETLVARAPSVAQSSSAAPPQKPLLLLHSGLVSDAVRTPRALLQALAQALPEGEFDGRPVRVVFRGSQADATYRPLTAALGLERWVAWRPALPYREALLEMLQADGLLLLQGEQNNPQVPAKVYEYFRAGRPVLGLVGEGSECTRLLAAEGLGATAPLEDEAAIEVALGAFLAQLVAGTAPVMPAARAKNFSRTGRTAELATVLGAAAS